MKQLTIAIVAALSIAAGIWFGLQLVSSMSAGDGPGVAFLAHVGGFVAGLALVPFMRRRGVRLFNPARRR